MASLTVRGLDDDVKHRLRVRAATKGLSLEEEVRRILTAAVVSNENARARTGTHLVDAIAAIVDPIGGIELDLPPRESDWEPPTFDDFPFDDDGPTGPDRGSAGR